MIIDFLLSSVMWILLIDFPCWSVISFLGWTLLDAVISLDEVWLEQDLSSLFSAFVSHLEKKKKHGCWSAVSESRLFPSCCPFTLCIMSWELKFRLQPSCLHSEKYQGGRFPESYTLHSHLHGTGWNLIWWSHLAARESVAWSLSWEARHNEQST